MKIMDKFRIMTYNIGFIKEPIDDIIEHGIAENSIVWMKHKYKDRFFADPFLLDKDSDFYYILCEEYLFFEEKGKITLLKVGINDFSLYSRKVIIEEDTHLSFPYCKFGQYDIYPESSESGCYWKYTIDKNTYSILSKELLLQEPLVDCVHFSNQFETLYFGSLLPNPNSNLCLFFDDNGSCKKIELFSNNSSISRSAGDFFEAHGSLYKPVQECSNRYGEQVNIMKVNFIGHDGIKLEKSSTLNSFYNKPFCQTFHTFNVYNDIIIVDGSYDFFRFPSKIFYKKLRFLYKNRINI